MNLQVPRPASAGLILSYRCTAQCRHCIYGCSPRWSGDWLPESDLKLILEQLAPHIQPSFFGPDRTDLSGGLHFSGGEPFANIKLLCRAVELAAELDIPSTFVETNCFWAVDDATTRERLITLRDLGLAGLMVSVNPFYLEYVPFANTARAVAVGQEVFGPNLMVYQVDYFRRFTMWGLSDAMDFDEYLKLEGRDDFIRQTEFFMMGRAPSRLADLLAGFMPRLPASDLVERPCPTPVVREWHNHLDNYSNYVPGFCGGLSFGDARRLDDLLEVGIDPDERPVLAHLMRDDLKGLLGLAAGRGFVEVPQGYFSKCHLCQELRRHLVEASGDEFPELAPSEFYKHLE